MAVTQRGLGPKLRWGLGSLGDEVIQKRKKFADIIYIDSDCKKDQNSNCAKDSLTS